MGRPPAYLFVVRHGYRLDAADKQWHLSSPAPYDPPLTYSGWQQAKNLGVRIASILHDRVKEDELAASQETDPTRKPKRKRYQVVLHSSPFLRCIQTSIAISAGLAQDSTPFEPSHHHSHPPTSSPAPGARPTPTIDTHVPHANSPSIRRSLLRLDAFLGEWLSPGYFELITPPPESVMMLAGAKADLLRREDYNHYPSFSGHTHSESQGHLWSPTSRGSSSSPQSDVWSNGLGSMSNLTSSLPSSPGASNHGQRQQPTAAGYVSPVPHYAVNNNNTIPPGYVSHARDACVDIDYQWDSTRAPLDWGDGGEFPEEWPDMHKRFRTGVQRLIDWYSTTENPTQMVTRTAARARKESVGSVLDDFDDVDTESVVILVSHGAGCNALIGAITHQPVLMDVGMTSLTMATRKLSTGSDSGNAKRPGSQGFGETKARQPIHELYEMKLVANTDHIRAQPPTATSARAPSMANVLNIARGRHSSFSTPSSDFSWSDRSGSRGSSANAALSGIRKTANNTPPSVVPRISLSLNSPNVAAGSSMSSPPSSSYTAASRPSNLGRAPRLWAPILSQDEDEDEDEEEDDIMLLNFSHVTPSTSTAVTTPKAQDTAANTVTSPSTLFAAATAGGDGSAVEDPLPPMPNFPPARTPKIGSGQLGAGPGGLWGGTSPPDEADQIRDLSASKRRWTFTERS